MLCFAAYVALLSLLKLYCQLLVAVQSSMSVHLVGRLTGQDDVRMVVADVDVDEVYSPGTHACTTCKVYTLSDARYDLRSEVG